MAEYFKRPFAENGDKVAIPTDTTLDESVSLEQGWTGAYQRDPATDPTAKRLERAKHNYLFNKITENIKEWQEKTFPAWIADAGSGVPFAYGKDAIVTYTDGRAYVSLADANTGEPSVSNDWAFANFVKQNGDETIAGIKTFSSSPIVPTPTTGTQAVNKDYVDNSIALKTIASGTATFDSVTNNINLAGIGIGVELGDVIQISGATDSKNNSEFTVEVITDDNNIIVNQAHANKSTTKNVANRSGDTDVTVKLLAKYYNAPLGLGQGWVDVTAQRATSTSYPNTSGRAISVSITAVANQTSAIRIEVDGIQVNQNRIGTAANLNSNDSCSAIVPAGSVYSQSGQATISFWVELR